VTEQEDLHEGGGESATKPQSNNVPFSAEKQVGESSGFLRESPLDKCLRESLSGTDKGLWERPTRLLTVIKTRSQD